MPSNAHFTVPGNYRIEVQGHLRASWVDHFGSMTIESSLSKANIEVTVLKGKVSDQSELAGILNTLYELHMPLLSVQYLDNTTTPNP